jgi:hypothetical protein
MSLKVRVEEDKGLTGYSEVTIADEKGFLGMGTEFVRERANDTPTAFSHAYEKAVEKGIITPKK